jgi:hypothetical protein
MPGIRRPSGPCHLTSIAAGWSSPVARQAHNLKVEGSNPSPATIKKALETQRFEGFSLSGR